MSTIGNRIRNKRHELGMSVDELAERLGKNRATVYRYESDEIENFPIAVIAPLADALNTTPAYLMGWNSDFDESEVAPTPPEEDGLDADALEAMQLFISLSETKKNEALNYLRYLSERAGI